jgi:hypothetical protein
MGEEYVIIDKNTIAFKTPFIRTRKQLEEEKQDIQRRIETFQQRLIEIDGHLNDMDQV